MSATLTNGRPRKQLADQLDRLDAILDGLAEALNQAVADAAREGTRLAVKEAVVEIVTDPHLRALLAPNPAAPAPVPVASERTAPAAPAPVPKHGFWARLKATAGAARAAVAAALARKRDAVARRVAPLAAAARAAGQLAGEALPARRMALVGLAVGAVVTGACLLVPHTAAAVVGGAGATATAVAVQTGRWLARAARAVGLLI